MSFTGGFRDDVDNVAGYDQAHASASEALRDAKGFFLIAMKGDDFEAHVAGNITREEMEDLAMMAARVSSKVVEICQQQIAEDGL